MTSTTSRSSAPLPSTSPRATTPAARTHNLANREDAKLALGLATQQATPEPLPTSPSLHRSPHPRLRRCRPRAPVPPRSLPRRAVTPSTEPPSSSNDGHDPDIEPRLRAPRARHPRARPRRASASTSSKPSTPSLPRSPRPRCRSAPSPCTEPSWPRHVSSSSAQSRAGQHRELSSEPHPQAQNPDVAHGRRTGRVDHDLAASTPPSHGAFSIAERQDQSFPFRIAICCLLRPAFAP